MLADELDYLVGVDTHRDEHVLAVVAAPAGAVVARQAVWANAGGYREALRAAGIEHQKVIAGHGSPIPFLRRGSRDQLYAATGTKKLPTLKLPDGTIISHSRAILAWVLEQSERGDALKRVA